MRAPRLAKVIWPLAFALIIPVAVAAPRTLTASDGRTLEAEVLGYKGDTLRIRRVDTGKEFRLPLSSLTASDQEELRAFFAQNPDLRDTIAPTDIRVEYSRARFGTDRINKDAYEATVENWGYSLTIANLTNTPITGLRIDYLVFAEIDPDGAVAAKIKGRLERKRGSQLIDTLAARDKASLRSETIACRTEKLEGDSRWVTEEGLKRKYRDKIMYGIWLRVYDGDKMIHEACSPASLRTDEPWETLASSSG